MCNLLKNQESAYPLDNSGIIHLAAMRKNYTNTFRIAVTMKNPVCPTALQNALNYITPRFPTIIAGIHPGLFQYKVIPVTEPPQIQEEQDCLETMTMKELRNCAFRVLYGKYKIAVEIFHSLTDGYGGMVVTNTLVGEYLRLMYSISRIKSNMLVNVEGDFLKEEVVDDYYTYSGKKAAIPKHQNVYQLPGSDSSTRHILMETRRYEISSIINAAHYYGVSLTAFLTSIMAQSIMEVRKRHQSDQTYKKSIQIMIPVNLRNIFQSSSVRNFSLYALVCVKQRMAENTFEELVDSISKQLKEQTTKEYMAAEMACHTKGERFFLYRMLPLPVKWFVLRIGHKIWGEGNSCISISNLGKIDLPESFGDYIEGIEFALTPRIQSPYNCGVVTFQEKIYISFTRNCLIPELEEIFFTKLEDILKERQ